ncbi:hypothetical protein KKE06_05535 [Candidatus Micrarchaeota archaeon]|nr:hypothetical protein [Candidatus Micrarchaeota archaeon]MBU1930897.1 hypothetical protein [Candidatus Micrarchaeota archaeon]
MNTRILGSLGLFLLLGFSVSGFSIIAPEKVVAHASWDFRVEFDLLDSFYVTEVLLDGKSVLLLYSNYTVVLDPFNSQKVVSTTAFDKKLFVNMTGLNSGSHSLVIQTKDSGNQVLSSQNQTILVIEPLSTAFEGDILAQINALKTENDSLQEQLDQANQKILALEQELSNQNRKTNEQKTELKNLSALVDLLQQKQASSMEFDEGVSQQVQELESRLGIPGRASDGQLDQGPSTQGVGAAPLTGLVTQSGSFSWTTATILSLVILVVIIGYTVYRHTKEKKLY